jgi:thiamine pyrophosphate-dependent acetolactate synthase large subunit-like protein
MSSISDSDLPRITGGEAVLRFLELHTSGTVFGLPGSSSVPIFHKFPDTTLRFMPALQEGAALSTADGYSRHSGLTGVLLYMAPGVATAMSNLYNAYRDGSPLLLVISQQATYARWGQASVGEADIVDMVKPFSRFAREVSNAEQLIPLLDAAMRAANGPPAGPAVVVVPEVIDRLFSSERPLIIVGGQLRQMGGAEAIERLSDAFEIPIMYEPFWNDRLGVSPSRYGVLGQLGQHSSVAAGADWVLAIGCRMFNEVHPRTTPWFNSDAFVAHVNADPARLEETNSATWSCVADPAAFAIQLLDMCRDIELNESIRTSRRLRLDDAHSRRSTPRLGPYSAAVAALAAEPDKSFVVDESVSANQILLSGMKCVRGDRYFSTTGGSLGWGIGAACGLALASQDSVTCILGDGAFFFGLQGLWLSVELNLPITFVVLDNGGFGSTRGFEARYVEEIDADHPHFVGSNFGSASRSITRVAEGFGIKCHDITDSDLGWWLEDVRGSGPVLLRVPIQEIASDEQ